MNTMNESEDTLSKSFSVIVKTSEIKLKNVGIETTVSDLREIIAMNIYEPARSIKLLHKDKILSLHDTIWTSNIENNSKIVALPCYTMKHGLWNFIDDYNNERNEMQNIKLVYFLTDKTIEKAQYDGNIEYYQPIGIYWQSRSINPMPYLENDFKRIEKRVGRVTPIFEFQKQGQAILINIIFRECESNLDAVLNQYEERIKNKLSNIQKTCTNQNNNNNNNNNDNNDNDNNSNKNEQEVHLNIIYSNVLDQHNYWFKEESFGKTIRFLSRVECNVSELSMDMQKLNINGQNLLLLCKYIGDKCRNVRRLRLNLRDNSFEGQLIVDLGKTIGKLKKLEVLEIDLYNIVIYNQQHVVELLDQIGRLADTLHTLVTYLPKDLNITYYTSSTISYLFTYVFSALTRLQKLQIFSDSRFQLFQDYYTSFMLFIRKAINLIHFDLIFYCDYLRESTFFNLTTQILTLSQNLTHANIVNYTQDFAIVPIQKRFAHLLQVIAFYNHISSIMQFKQVEILFDLFDFL